MLLFFSKFSTENEEGEEDFSEEEGEQRKSTISLKKVQPCWFAIFLIKTNFKESSGGINITNFYAFWGKRGREKVSVQYFS